MIRIRFSGKFDQMYKEIVREDREMRDFTNEAVGLFEKNPDDTRLDNHRLKRYMKGKWSFGVTDDVRIVYIWQSKNVVRFLAIGKHPQVYRKH